MTPRVAVVGLLAVAVLVSACSGGGGSSDDGGAASSTVVPTTSAATSTTARVPRLDPNSVLVANGYRFGTPPPSLAATTSVYRADDLVLGSEVALAWDARRIVPVADVVVLALDAPALVDDEIVDAYVAAFRTTVAKRGQRTAWFRHGNLLVVLAGKDRAAVDALAKAMRAAVRVGRSGGAARSTPMRAIPAGSVFVELDAARFEPYPTASDTTLEGTPTTEEPEPPPAPPGLGPAGAVGEVVARQVVIGGEVRAAAWALAVRTSVVESAEALEPMIEQALGARSRARVTTSVLADRTVWATDRRRAFRHGNVVVVVEGAESVQLDALIASWLAALVR